MKTNEFIKRVEELGFSVKEKKYTYANEVWLIVREVEHAAIMGVEKNTRFLIDTDYASFIYLDDDLREELFNIAVEYAKTPVEERKEEEKKYYLKLPCLRKGSQYLNYNKSTGTYITAMKGEYLNYQTKFTMEEIEKLKEKYNLDSFEIVDVEE